MTEKNKSVKKFPNLRFPGFEGEWEVKKLQDIVKINQGLQIPISERLTTQIEGSYFYITNEFLKENSEKKYYINNPPLSVLCNTEDILMTRTGNTGKVVTNVEGAFHNNFFKVAYPKNIAKGFLYNFLKLPKIQNQISKLAGTSTIPDLNHSDFYKIKLPFPTFAEQQKIAEFLYLLDERIQTQKKIIEELKLFKITVAKKIFSQQLRFKADNVNDFQKWDVKKLEEIFYSEKGKGISKSKIINDGNYECILYGELYTKYNEVVLEVVSRTNSQEGLKSKIGDLLIPSSTTTTGIDLANVTALNKENVFLGGDITVLRSAEKINNVFYAYYLSNHKKDEIASYAQGITIVHLYYNHIKKMIIDFPCIEEQTKIANFLSSIDEKIETEKKILAQYETQKKHLLSNLFI